MIFQNLILIKQAYKYIMHLKIQIKYKSLLIIISYKFNVGIDLSTPCYDSVRNSTRPNVHVPTSRQPGAIRGQYVQLSPIDPVSSAADDVPKRLNWKHAATTTYASRAFEPKFEPKPKIWPEFADFAEPNRFVYSTTTSSDPSKSPENFSEPIRISERSQSRSALKKRE